MASPLDTQDWTLTANLSWEYKHDRYQPCWACRGRGTDIMYGEECSECSGSGRTLKAIPQQPETPPALIAHMRKAWQEYFLINHKA